MPIRADCHALSTLSLGSCGITMHHDCESIANLRNNEIVKKSSAYMSAMGSTRGVRDKDIQATAGQKPRHNLTLQWGRAENSDFSSFRKFCCQITSTALNLNTRCCKVIATEGRSYLLLSLSFKQQTLASGRREQGLGEEGTDLGFQS